MNSDHNWETVGVDPTRLTHGTYAQDSEQELGEGDIVGSYSADRITEGAALRKPFTWKAGLWVAISIRGGGGAAQTVEAYRLCSPTSFAGDATTYSRKVSIDQGDFARNDPQGFYHGMTVNVAGQSMVLTGPPACFIPEESQRAAEQLGLFA